TPCHSVSIQDDLPISNSRPLSRLNTTPDLSPLMNEVIGSSGAPAVYRGLAFVLERVGGQCDRVVLSRDSGLELGVQLEVFF
ncbi:MAG: hypothetical protein AAFY60_17785, partial [Myxococcota bacterium]